MTRTAHVRTASPPRSWGARCDFFPGKRHSGKNRYLWTKWSQFCKCNPKWLQSRKEQTLTCKMDENRGLDFSCPSTVWPPCVVRPSPAVWNGRYCKEGGMMCVGRAVRRSPEVSSITNAKLSFFFTFYCLQSHWVNGSSVSVIFYVTSLSMSLSL